MTCKQARVHACFSWSLYNLDSGPASSLTLLWQVHLTSPAHPSHDSALLCGVQVSLAAAVPGPLPSATCLPPGRPPPAALSASAFPLLQATAPAQALPVPPLQHTLHLTSWILPHPPCVSWNPFALWDVAELFSCLGSAPSPNTFSEFVRSGMRVGESGGLSRCIRLSGCGDEAWAMVTLSSLILPGHPCD